MTKPMIPRHGVTSPTQVRTQDVMRVYEELPQRAKERVWGHLQQRGTLGTTDPNEIAEALERVWWGPQGAVPGLPGPFEETREEHEAKCAAEAQKFRIRLHEVGENIATGYGVPPHIMEPEVEKNGQWFATNGSQDPALWRPLSRDCEPPQSPESQPWPPDPAVQQRVNEAQQRVREAEQRASELHLAAEKRAAYAEYRARERTSLRDRVRTYSPPDMLETCRHGLPLHAGEVYRCELCQSQRAGRWPEEADEPGRLRRFRGMPR